MLARQSGPPGPRPNLRTCYLCSQQFGTASIGIHVPQCYQKKIAQWERGDPSTRGQRPKHPDSVNWRGTGLSVSMSEEQQYQEYSANLSPCPNCNRTFRPDALQVHLRSCKAQQTSRNSTANRSSNRPSGSQGGGSSAGGINPSSTAGGTQRTPRRNTGVPPVLPRCYLCGQQFGTTSIQIHVPQCYTKKKAQWEAGDVHTRGQPPKHPDTVNWKGEGLSLDQQNDEQFKEFVSNLEPCPNCGRKFLADRLLIHLRSCKPGSTSKPVTRASIAPGSDGGSERPQPPSEKPAAKTSPARTPVKVPSPRLVKKPEIAQNLDPKRNRLPSDGEQAAGGVECAQCGAVEYDLNAKFCRDCGRNLRSKNLPDPCLKCGESIPEGSRFCATCGQPVDGAPVEERTPGGENINAPTVRMTHCPACAALCDADGNFCDNCGAVLGDAEPVLPPISGRRSPATANQSKITESMVCEMCHEEYDDMTCLFCEECGEKLVKKYKTEKPRKKIETSKVSEPAKILPKEPVESKDSSSHHGGNNYLARTQNSEGTVPEDVGHVTLIPCEHCGRRFAEPVLEKHINICLKTKRRPVFDGSKQRLQELASELPKKATKPTAASSTNMPKRDWRAESENLRKSLSEARKVEDFIKKGGDLRELPPPVYSENPDYVQCKHCQRKFAPDVAARHIPNCAKTINRPKAPPKRR